MFQLEDLKCESNPSCVQEGAPPTGYARSGRALSNLSTTTRFNTGLNERDLFLGQRRCIVCGRDEELEHCHIIPKTEEDTWVDLKRRGWLPRMAKEGPQHEPRNGFLLCLLHHRLFDRHKFFIRFFPNAQKFILIDYSDRINVDLQAYHGRAIALDIADKHAPFPSLFIIHEMRVRGYHPFHGITPDVPDDDAINWQDWVMTSGVWDGTKNHFRHHGSGAPGPAQTLSMTPIITGGPRGESSAGHTRPLEFNQKIIADILAATHAMPSWKECEVEGIRWTGTAEENTQKYLAIS